jgi:flavin-dependent dehydrogenase
MEKTLLAIVGASAAGLAAAISGARAGLDVTLIEAKPEIGTPPSHAIVGLDVLWPEEVERPPHTVRRRLPGTRVRVSDGRGVFMDGPLTLFDRARFDAYLADEARKAGAQILTGVQGLDARPDRSLVAPGLELRPDVLLFADGARTQASRFLASTRDPAAVQYGAAMEVYAPEPEDVRVYMTLGTHANGGRSQLNPLGGGRWSHWTFFRGDPAQGEAIARRALDVDARIMGWEKLDARFTGVGPDPFYTLPGQLAGEGVMAAGGAAGQGGLEIGLSSGWLAGETAARTLRGEGTLADYERAWRRRFGGFYERARRTNDAIVRLTDAELQKVMSHWDGRHINMPGRLWQILGNPRGLLAAMKASRLARSRT